MVADKQLDLRSVTNRISHTQHTTHTHTYRHTPYIHTHTLHTTYTHTEMETTEHICRGLGRWEGREADGKEGRQMGRKGGTLSG